jgi:hypothetical protein
VDPFAPTVRLTAASGMTWTRTRAVVVRVEATDDPSTDRLRASALDPEAVASGVGEMMVAMRSDFAGASWVPLAGEVSVWLPDADSAAVWVRVRDKAGNVSEPAMLAFRLAAATPVDAAIRLEERALDALRSRAWSAARDAIGQSLPQVDRSIRTVVDRIGTCGQKPDQDDVRLLVDLVFVRALKTRAKALSKPMTATLAERALVEALERERDIAERAMRRGLGL